MTGGSTPYNPRCYCQPVSLPVTRGVQRLIMSYEKFWIWSFLSISFANEQTLSQNCSLTFRQKQCFYLAHSVPEYFEKLPIKNANQTKNPTLSGYILNTGVNSESKLKFSESSFNFLQPQYNPWCHYQCLAKFKMLIFVCGVVMLPLSWISNITAIYYTIFQTHKQLDFNKGFILCDC